MPFTAVKNRLLSAFYGFIDIANNIYEAEVKKICCRAFLRMQQYEF